MLKAIQDFFRTRLQAAGPEGRHDDKALQLATAALLFEMVRADHEAGSDEREVVERSLRSTFDLDESETQALAALAEQEAEEAVSLYQFTALINRHFTPQDKVRVVEMLWRVAWADGRLHPYEEALVRKIAELIHVPHRDFIQAKHRVQGQLS
ncbi:MAG TPA: TerB family tellurite resistance protein [Gammaproteobacteria bacterium]|nr:TerB family tellurite resistance protein [Gammaproteobacteria bacterium]